MKDWSYIAMSLVLITIAIATIVYAIALRVPVM